MTPAAREPELRSPAPFARSAYWGPLAILAVVYLSFRIVLLGARFDDLAIPAYELSPMGNLAYLLSEGVEGIPIALHYDNGGGQLVVGVIAAGFYTLLGPTYVALKCVPLLLGLACLWMIFDLVLRTFSARAAVFSALLFCFAPPLLTGYSVLAKGNHFEAVAFQLLCVYAFVRWRLGAHAWRRVFFVAAGFAVFFYFGSLLLLTVLVSCDLLLRRQPALNEHLRGVPLVLLGLSPLVWLELATGGRPSQFLLGAKFGHRQSWLRIRTRWSELWTEHLGSSPSFQDGLGIPGHYADLTWWGAFLAIWAWATCATVSELWRSAPAGRAAPARWLRLSLCAYFPAWSLAYAVGNFEFDLRHEASLISDLISGRYLVTFFALALVLAGIELDRLLAAGNRWTRGTGAVAATLLGATCAFVLPLADGDRNRSFLDYRGYDFRRFGKVAKGAGSVVPRSDEEVAEILERLPPVVRSDAYLGVGNYIGFHGVVTGSRRAPEHAWASFRRALKGWPAWAHVELARGIGSALAEPSSAYVDALVVTIADQEDWRAEYVLEGLGLDYGSSTQRTALQSLTRLRRWGGVLDGRAERAWERGYGMQLGEWFVDGIVSRRTVLASCHQSAERAFGLGWGVFARGGPGSAAVCAAALPDAPRDSFWRGVGAAARHLSGRPTAWSARVLLTRVPPAARSALLAGARWPGYPDPGGVASGAEPSPANADERPTGALVQGSAQEGQ